MTEPASATEATEASFWQVQMAQIAQIRQEVPGIATYELELEEAHRREAFRFEPGQFNMMYLPGYGESAISISSDPATPKKLEHTVRVAGNVTRAISRLQVGDRLGIRGPFGSAWPLEASRGHDLVLACGGVGLAPLRSAIYQIMHRREEFDRVILLYGARTPADLLYTAEFDRWREAGIEIEATVDLGDANWEGHIGVVPVLFYRLRLRGERTWVWTCGPEVMMRFVIFEALARKVPPRQIILSMERNMNCAVGLCGHCQLGPAFVCRDGPVFTYEQMEPYLHLEDL